LKTAAACKAARRTQATLSHRIRPELQPNP